MVPPPLNPSVSSPGSGRCVLILAVVSLVLLTYHLDGTPFRGLYDDVNRSLIARNMVDSGNWVAATSVYGPLYTKPPLMYWAAAGLGLLTGRSDELPGNLTSVVSMFLVVLATFWAGRNLFGNRAGLGAGLLLITMHLFLGMGRQALLDTVMMAGFALTFGSLVHLGFSGTATTTRWWVATALGLGISFLTKGPVILPIFLLLWLPLLKPVPRLRPGWRHTLLAVAVIAAVTLPWPIALLRAAPEAVEVWRNELFGRFGDGKQYLEWTQKPFWFYGPDLANTLPWVFLLPWAVAVGWRQRRDPRFRLLLWWALGGFVFFSFASATKRSYYLLPLYPAFALLMAAAWDRLLAKRREGVPLGRGDRWAPQLTLGLLVVLGLALMILPWQFPLLPKAAFMACGFLTTTLSSLAFLAALKGRWLRVPLLAVAAAASLHLAYFGHFVPLANTYYSGKPFFTEAVPVIGDRSVLVLENDITLSAFYLHHVPWRYVTRAQFEEVAAQSAGSLVITAPEKAARFPQLESLFEREFTEPFGKKKRLGLYRIRQPQPQP